MQNIDYALVEEKRPPMYTAMKYWGKKPHNIWHTYIKTYTEEGEIILDPFSGSAIAAFEAVRCNRKALAFDINPLTSFMIDVYSSDFKIDAFEKVVNLIIEKIQNDAVYKDYYISKCRKCNEEAIIQHFKWDTDEIYEVGLVCPNCKERYLDKPDSIQLRNSKRMQNIVIHDWYPDDEFYDTPSISASFVNNIGGTHFSDIWTKRNLYVLAKINAEVENIEDVDLKKQLMFGLIQTVHLCSKMCVPRRAESNRSFSTSWGRSAYICSKRQMEMNPLMLFESSCLGKQSVKSALTDVKKHVGKVPKSKYVTPEILMNSDIHTLFQEYDIIYGVIDINTVSTLIPKESVKFIITDPPYGGLVQYMDLSYIWLIWLKHFDKRYNPDISKEITIKKGLVDIQEYSKKFTSGMKNLYDVMAQDAKIVFTFHNKELMVWNAFLRSISHAGFKIEKVIHQQNRRTGESNVANPYGTSASDFYIRCSKSDYVKKIETSRDEFENFIVDRAVKIISSRNEATPYQILFNGLLSEISKAGFELVDFDENIHQLLSKHIGEVFEIEQTNKAYGPLWWLVNKEHIQKDVIPLSQRVEVTVKEVLKRNGTMSIDDILAEVFIKYPNGLAPDVKKIDEYIRKYACPSGERWIYNGK